MSNVSFSPVVGDNGGVLVPPSNPTTPLIPRLFTPKSEEKYVSLVIEMKGDASDASVNKLKKSINYLLCTKLSGFFPELLFYTKDIFKIHKSWIKFRKPPKNLFLKKGEVKLRFDDIKLKKIPNLPFKLERLFPDSEKDLKSAKKFSLDKFLLLTIPVFERQFERRTSSEKLQATLFEISYILNGISEIKSTDPTSRYKRFELLSGGSSATNQLPRNWMLDNMQATTLPRGVNGNGIVIGHPDSGWTPHTQLNFLNVNTNPISPNFDLNRDWNVFNDDNSAEESLVTNALTKFHGTATSSIIISQLDNQLTGVATGSTILPIRTISQLDFTGIDTGVVLIGDTDVARAVWYAIQQNVDVISLSLGGYPMAALECVIAHAVYNNIIVTAAAGQYWPFLVYPAGYPECIAVGASNNNNRPWQHCVKHSKIAISAPGEDVYCADWDNNSPNRRAVITSGSGCSFSTAYVAGAAALWLQNYGKQTLLTGLNGRATLQELFLAHIQLTATLPNNWNTRESGAGIINIANLLNRNTLPNLPTFTGRSWNNWSRRTALELMYSIFENTDPVIVRERLEVLMNTNDVNTFMQTFGQEVVSMFMMAEDAVELFKEALENTAQQAVDVIEEVVEVVKDLVSNTIAAIAGLFT